MLADGVHGVRLHWHHDWRPHRLRGGVHSLSGRARSRRRCTAPLCPSSSPRSYFLFSMFACR
ncbi:hypothetical protein EON67_12365 [archaeon]|nr:MAG: hypothetical protein EON67_12365 [archaeon]